MKEYKKDPFEKKNFDKSVEAFKKSKGKQAKHKALEARSKKAGFYVYGHKNFGDVYEP